MGWNTRTIFQGALGCGLLLVAVAVAVVWRQASSDRSRLVPTSASHSAERPAAHATRADLEAIEAEIERLKGSRNEWERHTTAMQRELMTLRSQLTQTDRSHVSRARTTRRGTEKSSEGRRGRPTVPGQDDAATTQSLTPEEEVKQADEHLTAQVELIETTMLAEQADPAWATTAEQAFRDALQSEELAGVHLEEAACRTTLCRVALTLDSATVLEESFRILTHLAPWHGQGFVRIDQDGSGAVVMYLARAGYTLPQVTE